METYDFEDATPVGEAEEDGAGVWRVRKRDVGGVLGGTVCGGPCVGVGHVAAGGGDGDGLNGGEEGGELGRDEDAVGCGGHGGGRVGDVGAIWAGLGAGACEGACRPRREGDRQWLWLGERRGDACHRRRVGAERRRRV